jgi:hypothetical protein
VTELADQDHDRKGRATGCCKRGECSREKRERSQHLGQVLIFAFSAHQLFWAAMARREFITDALAGPGCRSQSRVGNELTLLVLG